MKAAPHHFPYHHRTLAGHTDAEMLDRYEYCQRRFNTGLPNWRDVDRRILRLSKAAPIIHTIAAESPANGGTVGADAGIKAVQEGFCRATPEPDQLADKERTAMIPNTARSPSAQPIKGGA